MAERGDVLQIRTRIGFGRGSGKERVVVVQATELNSVLPTMLVVPLDAIVDPYVDRDLLVRVSGREVGARQQQVAIPTYVRFVRSDAFEPGRVGRLNPSTLAELDEKLRLALDL